MVCDVATTTCGAIEDGEGSSLTFISIDTDVARSYDDRYIALDAPSINGPSGSPLYIHDRQAGVTRGEARTMLGTSLPSITIEGLAISGDGRYVSFTSRYSSIVPGDTNGSYDLFLRAIPTMSITSVVPDHLPIGAKMSATVFGTNFLPEVFPGVGGGRVSNAVRVDENTYTMDIIVPRDSTAGADDVYMMLLGTGPGGGAGVGTACASCVTFF